MAGQLFYASGAVTTTLAAPLTSGGTSIQLTSITGYPTQYPFTLLLDWGGGSQEVVTVTQAATGAGPYTYANCLRGQDGTTGVVHSSGATVSHGVSARDFFQAAPVYNVCAYGADPTGAADSATAIQAALTACRTSSNGGIVYVPPGTYITGQILQIGSNTTLAGAGMGVTTIKAKSSMNPAQIGSVAGITVLQVYNEAAASNITVRDLTIDGNEAGNTSIPSPFSSGFSAAVRLDQVDKLHITRIEVINSILYSIWLNACTRFKVDHCTILSGQNTGLGYNDQDGIHCTNSQRGVIAGNLIDTGTSSTTGDDAICLQSLTTAGGGGAATGGGGPAATSDITVTGNTIRSGTRGISLLFGGAPVSDVTISGNVIWGTQADGIILAQDILGSGVTSNITIAGNTLVSIGAGAGGNGITLMDPKQIGGSGAGWADVTICGNTFDGFPANANFGIYAVTGSGLKISENIFAAWQANTGIQVGDNSGGTSEPVTGFTVSGNVMDMSASTVTGANAITVIDSASGVVAGNTLTGNGTTGSAAVLLGGVDATNLVKSVTVTGNTLTGWATGVVEANFGTSPDWNVITGNNCHGSTIAVTVLGPHTLSQHPVPDIGGVTLTEQFVALSGSYTLTSTTAAQKLFNASSNGALTVPAATLFFFECEFDLTSMSATSGTFSFGLGGTATFSSLKYRAAAQKTAAAGTLATWPALVVTTASATALVAASTTTTGAARISGTIRVNAGGTIIPQVTLSVAAAAVVSANSWFRLTPVAAGGVTTVGNWT